ncbi:TetR/AcrR family transcriptional regulator [Corynebacterium sp. NPDC060344]|uniref:TetR/AcrR family transcriptional regulator n=1 Tax=Corynebacterium sp. NPDC060344 TaxID=3347101 RepID=UPI003667B1AE
MPRRTKHTAQRDRAAMTEKILDAAEALLRRDTEGTGIPPLTLGDVAKEVGLARSSLYRYFAGVEELIEAVSMRGFDEWVTATREHVESVKGASGPRAAILAFTEDNLRRAPEGELRWRNQLLRVHLDELTYKRVMERHETATDILTDCVADLPGLDGDVAREQLRDGLRMLISGGVLAASDHPESVEAHIRLFTASADAMMDEATGGRKA